MPLILKINKKFNEVWAQIFAANFLSYLGISKVNCDSWCKLMPFSLKEFLKAFDRQKSRDLICIFLPVKYDKICKRISLKKV